MILKFLIVTSALAFSFFELQARNHPDCSFLKNIPHSDKYKAGCKVRWIGKGDASGHTITVAEYAPTKLPSDLKLNADYIKAYAIYTQPRGGAAINMIWVGGGSEDSYVSEPDVIDSKFGKMLLIGRGSGNGVSENEVLKWSGRKWAKVDVDSWRSEIKLPEGYSLKAPTFGWRDFHYESGVEKPGDCSACASGGKVLAELDLKNNKVIIKKYEFIPEKPEDFTAPVAPPAPR